MSLHDRLQSEDAGIRQVALLEFADSAEDALLPAVIALLRDDPDEELRAEAARALAGYEDADAVEALAVALDDQPAVAAAAAGSLAELKNAQVGAVLLRHVRDEPAFALSSVLRALKELRIPAAAQPALAALTHVDASVRREAVGVLGWLKFTAALPGIGHLAVADVDVDVRRTACGALGMAAQDADVVDVRHVLTALIACLKDHAWQVREEAATTLGKFRAAHDGVAEALRAGMQDDYWQVRLRAARSLGRLRDAEALPVLIEALLHSAGNLRKEAAIALGEIGDPGAIDALKASNTDPDPEVRKAVRLALAQFAARRAGHPAT
jgi:HEAT repeat protein